MVHRKVVGVPRDLARVNSRLMAWRRTRQAGARIPESLWSAAAKLVGVHGLARVASTLSLDYYALKKRVNSVGSDDVRNPAFIELPAALPSESACVIEFDDGRGATMRIQVKGCDTPDVISLARHFWRGD